MSHPLGSVEMSRPLGSVEMSRPLGSVEMSRPLGSVEMSHPLGSVEMSHPLGSVEMSRPLGSVEMSRPLGSVEMLRPLGSLHVNKIVDELYQGVEGVPLITQQVYDEIRNAKSNKEANTIFMRHLLTAGTVKQFWLFCKVLHQTSDDYGVHEEILEKLKEDFNISF